ncbi:hypothetical protein Lal_00033603 [Lupinus albus]|nr:hypothetical protein Lal_00033603 [Lupinus albus]
MVATGNSSALNRRMREEQIVPTRYRQEFLTIAWEEVHLGNTDNIILLGNGDTLSIPLVMYERSNKNTCMHKKPQVQRDGAATVGRELAFGKNILVSTSKETCLKLPVGKRGRVIDVRRIHKKGVSSYHPEMIRIYILQKREIKVGDKVVERHGNKASKQKTNSWIFQPEYRGKSRIVDGRTWNLFEQPVIMGKSLFRMRNFYSSQLNWHASDLTCMSLCSIQ